MIGAPFASAENDLDTFIAAFEAALASAGAADLDTFLPEPSHPLYGDVLLELVRVDLEHHWMHGVSRRLEEYRPRFPQLFESAATLAALTFEEFRLRRQAGEAAAPEEYEERFGGVISAWPRPVGEGWTSNGSSSAANTPASQLPTHVVDVPRRYVPKLPVPGDSFVGFQLIRELGRGSFARVYLARQGELADRPVVLKIARDVLGESHTLAQLQHANIVPIHSIHHAGPFHAVCMPFFGTQTLADVLKDVAARMPARPGLTRVETMLWIGARLASGLAHAHERGILHRDLKPANILLADNGQPMLLDFNLSEDIKLRSFGTAAALLGGTLHYMAPEHLAAFGTASQPVDARSDIYALGVVLYQLLAGQHPFVLRQAPLTDLIPDMICERRQAPPDLRRCNRAISPAVASIVRHCLEPEPGCRYQTAAQLQDDLDRHLQHLPLRHAREPSRRERTRKWLRRHPRLFSASGIAILAVIGLGLLGALALYHRDKLERLEAAQAVPALRQELRSVQLGFLDVPQTPLTGIAESCRRALDRFQILDNAAWQQAFPFCKLPAAERELVRADAGELLFLLAGLDSPQLDTLDHAMALNRRAEECFETARVPAAVWHQRAMLAERMGQHAAARHWRNQGETTGPRGPRDCCMLACLHERAGRPRSALALWQRATEEDAQNVWAWYGLGTCHDSLGQWDQAAACYSSCMALNPGAAVWHFKRGLARLRQGLSASARADFDLVLRLEPDNTRALSNRALAWLADKHDPEVIQDLNAALELGAGQLRLLLLRAQARERLGDSAGAERDRAEALRRTPVDEADWIARGASRAATDPHAALADFDAALRLNPRSLPALESKAHVLAEKLDRLDDALRILNKAASYHPEHAPIRAAHGVLLARHGDRAAARKEAEAALALSPAAETMYQVACIYALTSRTNPEDRPRALSMLATALRQGYGHALVATDKDLNPVRNDPECRRLLQAAAALANARKER